MASKPSLRFWPAKSCVSVIRLQGVIGDAGAFRKGLRAVSLEPLIKRAFSLHGLKAVVLQINSPGGSPAQASLIAGRIRRLAEEKNVPVIAFCEDVAASGGYWLACAADEIYVDANSVVGSIGVISAGFGFPELLKRWGIERRVHTAGERKGMLDPFRSEDEKDVAHLAEIQRDIHEGFKDFVRTRRGARLAGDEDLLFSGAFWAGLKARDLGLVDGVARMDGVLEEKFGKKIKLRRFDQQKFRFWRLPFMGGQGNGLAPPSLGPEAANAGRPDAMLCALVASLEERSHWSRFGL